MPTTVIPSNTDGVLSHSLGRWLREHLREVALTGFLSVLLIFLAIAAPAFYEAQPLLSLLARQSPVLVCACGVALIIISRQIDISIGSQFAVCGVCAGLLAAQGVPLPIVLLSSILIGAAMGAINGLLVAGLGLPSIVVTLATMVTWREALRWLRQGQFVNLPDQMQWFGLTQRQGQFALIAAALVIFGLIVVMTSHFAAGRWIFAVGSNFEAARLAGLRPARITWMTFVFMGGLVGVGATMNLVQSPQVDPKAGTGLELQTIAAVVIGGISIAGGRGALWAVLPGVLLLACITPALTHLHVQAYWEKAIQGIIILLAVLSEGLEQKRMRRT